MGAFTDLLEAELLDHVLGNGAYSPPAQVYVGLLSADADAEDQTFTEISGGGYARVAASFGAAAQGDPTEAANDAVVDYGDLTTDGSASHFALFDAASGGNALVVDVLRDGNGDPTTVSWTGANNEPLSFPVGTLKIQLD